MDKKWSGIIAWGVGFVLIFSLIAYIGMAGLNESPGIQKTPQGVMVEIDETTKETTMNPSDIFKIHFIDVGQGKSILIQKGNKGILIDGGEKEYGAYVVAYLRQAQIEQLEYIVATHPHSDHMGGLLAVVDAFPVEMVLMPDAVNTTNTYETWMDKIVAAGIPVLIPKAGDIIDFHSGEFLCISPNQAYEELNNMSLVYRFQIGEFSFLFTGDIENKAEKDMVISLLPIASTILDLPHHGSYTSSHEEFLKKVEPKIVVISVGKDNPYDHPHEEVMKRLESMNIEIRRTDTQGNIVFQTDGIILE